MRLVSRTAYPRSDEPADTPCPWVDHQGQSLASQLSLVVFGQIHHIETAKEGAPKPWAACSSSPSKLRELGSNSRGVKDSVDVGMNRLEHLGLLPHAALPDAKHFIATYLELVDYDECSDTGTADQHYEILLYALERADEALRDKRSVSREPLIVPRRRLGEKHWFRTGHRARR